VKTAKKYTGPKPTRRFVRTSGAPFGAKDAPLIGEALQQIADENRVNNIRSLSPEMVFGIIETDPNHPLRTHGNYNWSIKEAARAHWIDHTALLIRSIHVVVVQAGRRDTRHPMFVIADAPTHRNGGVINRRTRVLHEDALENDPVFMSAISVHIRRIHNALAQLENLTSCRRPPAAIARLVMGLRGELDEYAAVGEAAAE
jgi:hypothetical protein